MLGYVRMLRDIDSHCNAKIMLEILEDLLEIFLRKMQKGFVDVLLKVGSGKLKWEESAIIQKHRFTKCRVYRPVAKTIKRKPVRESSCCAAFQNNACNKAGNHGSFIHTSS